MKPGERELKFKMVSVEKLADDPRNPRRRISGHERERLIESIKRWGFVVPVLVSGGTLVDGHQRLDVAKELGIKKVPMIDLGNLTEQERIALNVATDRIRTDFDPRKVLTIIEHFKVKEPELAAMTGFTDDDLAMLKETQAKLDTMDTSFLDDFEEPEQQGDQYETNDAAGKKGKTSDRVRVQFVLTTAQRDEIVEKLQAVKNQENLDSMADALCWLTEK